VAKLRTLDKYNCVIITDVAQLGISPINPLMIGPAIGLLDIRLATASCPMKNITKFRTNVIMNIKSNIFRVCFKLDLNIPSSSQLQ